METTHRLVVGDSRDMALADDSVDLVVTSPPYPMIEMWDGAFESMNPEVGAALADDDGERAFEAMHAVLDDVWAEVQRVLRPGGVACVNVGDATRTVDGRFRVYPNHARVLSAFEDLGFDPLPDILWRKPANSAAKFMGFRNGERREFDPGADRRYEAAYFWEERNSWFSDVWTDVRGERQTLADDDGARERSAAFPFAVPYRLVNMYSVYGDTVLDPFWGTGTTSLAAMVAARNSVGVERDPDLVAGFEDRVDEVPDLATEVVEGRLADHEAFVEEVREQGDSLGYEAEYYDTPVRTKQERGIRFYGVDDVTETADGYRLAHSPVDGPTESPE
jgi:site-specific DNA-methyltransferase (cytosine-N4-specific)